MSVRFGVTRKKALVATALAAALASTLLGSVSAVADGDGGYGDGGYGEQEQVRPDHWGVIARNTIGSPVADLRNGPFGSFGVTDSSGRPPYGRGSLGIAVSDQSTSLTPASEKVDFGNEVDFFGDPVQGLQRLGFHVFQTGENVQRGGAENMPNIRFEIDPNLAALPNDNYSTMVWVPDASPVTNRWSSFIDATTTGYWFLSGNETTCTQAAECTFDELKASLNDGGDGATIYTAAVGKGRDHMWIGAVDGLRINDNVYDFEANGVRVRNDDD
ncbi:hypothetical protein OG616_36750 [Streptomyces antibioticus]|uniref:hypothetical protein n=1 Tax=Streptomyces antibioticus TaxID=1890 RepID=UPI0022540501|nr:hypothetical protein [Streptomyces antibioticus]MCX5173554.1 hypothetical protein [Streptomyces antibioticus]